MGSNNVYYQLYHIRLYSWYLLEEYAHTKVVRIKIMGYSCTRTSHLTEMLLKIALDSMWTPVSLLSGDLCYKQTNYSYQLIA